MEDAKNKINADTTPKWRFFSAKSVIFLIILSILSLAALQYISLIEVDVLKRTPLTVKMMDTVHTFTIDQDWKERQQKLTDVVDKFIFIGMDQKTVEAILHENGFEFRSFFSDTNSGVEKIAASHPDRKLFLSGQDKSYLVIWVTYQDGLVSVLNASYTVRK